MQTNAQIRIYSASIYLFKASNINSRTRCKIYSKLTKTPKRLHRHENSKEHRWRSDVFIVNFEQIPHLNSWILDSVTGWVYRRRSKGRDINIIHARAGTKLCKTKQTGQTTTWIETWSNLKSMQSKALNKYL